MTRPGGRWWRRVPLGVAGVALPFLAGMAAVGCRGPAPRATPAEAGGAADGRDAIPAGNVEEGRGEAPGGVPVGWPRSEVGARDAAVTVVGAAQVAESISAVATPEAAPGLIEEATARVRLVRDATAAATGQVWWVVRPLAVRVVSYTEERATVAVWAVTVLSAAGVAVPQSSWATVTAELVWLDGGWRVDGLARRNGPTPVLDASDEPWAAETLASALDGFELLAVGR